MYDFLDDLGLVSTQSVFLAETNTSQDQIKEGRRVAEESFGAGTGARRARTPSLVHMLERHGSGGEQIHRKSPREMKSQSPKTPILNPHISEKQQSPDTSSPHMNMQPLSPKASSKVETGTPSQNLPDVIQNNGSPKNSPTSSSSFDANSVASRVSPKSRTPKGLVVSPKGSYAEEKSGGKKSAEDDDDYGEDDYEDDDDFEDVVSDGSDLALEIADDGLVQSGSSFGDSSDFLPALNRSGTGHGASVRSSAERSTDSLNMSTSIVHDSMDLSVQGSIALDSYDFVEMAEKS